MGCNLQNMSFTEKVKLLHEQISSLDYTQFVKLLAGSADLQQLFLKIDNFNLKEYELTDEDRALMDTVKDKLNFDETQFQNILKNLSTLQAVLGKVDGLKFEDLVNVPELVSGKIPKVKPDGSGIFWVEPEDAANTTWGGIQGDLKNQTDLVAQTIYYVADVAEMRTIAHSPDRIATTDGRFGSLHFKKVASGTENGGTVFVLDNGDVYELQYDGIVNAKWFNFVTDGTDRSIELQAAIDAAPYGGSVFIAKGNYYASNITLPHSVSLIGEVGTTIRAAIDNASIITVKNDTTRGTQKYIEKIRFYGDKANRTGTTGIKLGDTNGASLYTVVRDCLIQDFDVGLDLVAAMEDSTQSTTVLGCGVGIKLRSVATKGGGNGNTFVDTHVQNNDIGIFIHNVEQYPLHNNIFIGGTVQGNKVAGVAIVKSGTGLISMQTFIGMHFEANASGADVSKTIDGVTIDRCSIYLDNAEAMFMKHDISSSVSPAILLKNKAIITLDGANGFGSTTGVFIDGTKDEVAIVKGATSYNGHINTNTIIGDDFLDINGAKMAFTSSILGVREFGDKNNVSASINPIFPKLSNRNAIVSVQREYDKEFGICESATFDTAVGSTSSNRGTLDVFPSATWDDRNAFIAVSFLVKANKDCIFEFTMQGGSHGVIEVNLAADVWKRVVIAGRSSSTRPSLYVYPKDDLGATLKITNIQSAISQNPAEISETVRGICYTRGVGYVSNSSAPTTGTFPTGYKIYSQSPSSGGNEGWICIAGGTPGTWKAFGSIES